MVLRCKSKLTDLLKTASAKREGVQSRHEPCEMTSGASWYPKWSPEPPDTQNDHKDPQNQLHASRYVSEPLPLNAGLGDTIVEAQRRHSAYQESLDFNLHGAWRPRTPSLAKMASDTRADTLNVSRTHKSTKLCIREDNFHLPNPPSLTNMSPLYEPFITNYFHLKISFSIYICRMATSSLFTDKINP